MKKMILACFCLWLPGLARAQSGTVTFAWPEQATTPAAGTTESIQSIGPSACGNTLSMTWSTQLVGTPCTGLKIWVTSGSSCGDDPASGDLEVAEVSSGALLATPTGTVSFDVDNIPIFNSEEGQACATASIEKTALVCGSVKVPQFGLVCGSSGQLTLKPVIQLKIAFDSLPPEAPVIEDVEPLDSSLSINWSADSDAALVAISIREKSSGALIAEKSYGATAGPVRIEGLENSIEYELRAVAEDAAGNRSTESEPVYGTPIRTDGFWAAYQEAGGLESGGCATAGQGGGFMGFGLGLLLFLRRRTRRQS